MANRNQRITHQHSEKSKTLWDYLYLNPVASTHFDTWRMIFESRRLCRQVDRRMKELLPPEQYQAYLAAGKPEPESWWTRWFEGRR